MKEVKEITTAEFVEELRLASEEGLKEFDESEATSDVEQLRKEFAKVDKAVRDEANLTYEKEMFERLNKDNEVLQQYIQLLEKLEKAKQIQEDAKQLYDKMNDLNIEEYEGKSCKLVLKRPYERRQLNSTLFMKDFKPDSSMYKKYVEVKLVKGHVSIKKPENKG